LNERLPGLYIHVPFCARVCPYCDFAVRTGDGNRRRRYVDHLLQEIELYRDEPLQFDTIYFGGGTPSALDPDQLERILSRLRDTLSCVDPWIFLEANPEDVTPESARDWRAMGVKTLSLGIQSFDAQALEFLGRQHSAVAARRAIELAHEAGFHTVSIDLIYGLPEQSETEWQREMETARELQPHHISCYQLTIHRRTRFELLERRGRLVQMGEDDQGERFRQTHRYFNAAGYEGYEVSQFAIDADHRSRHNSKYWDHTPYLGFGPSAHSLVGNRRWWNRRKTDDWQDDVRCSRRPIEESETLGAAALALEALMTGLRTYDGVDLERIEKRWGIDVATPNAAVIERLEQEGRLQRRGTRLVPTLEGLAVADSMTTAFELA